MSTTSSGGRPRRSCISRAQSTGLTSANVRHLTIEMTISREPSGQKLVPCKKLDSYTPCPSDVPSPERCNRFVSSRTRRLTKSSVLSPGCCCTLIVIPPPPLVLSPERCNLLAIASTSLFANESASSPGACAEAMLRPLSVTSPPLRVMTFETGASGLVAAATGAGIGTVETATGAGTALARR